MLKQKFPLNPPSQVESQISKGTLVARLWRRTLSMNMNILQPCADQADVLDAAEIVRKDLPQEVADGRIPFIGKLHAQTNRRGVMAKY